MKRKVLSVMLATAMTATLFAGCGSDASNADSANSADATASTTEALPSAVDALIWILVTEVSTIRL